MKSLARLSFWVPVEGAAEFDAAFRKRFTALLDKYDLSESHRPAAAKIDGICTYWFEDQSPAELSDKRRRLLEDPTFQELLLDWGKEFGEVDADGKLPYNFEFHRRPLGSGKSVPARPGTGQWCTVDCRDGLVDSLVQAIAEDATGHLWFGTAHGGACRYDGETFTPFTTRDGLAGNEVWAITADRQGAMWFGTNNGASRYDGQKFVTFSERDGLTPGNVRAIKQDRSGDLWFATESGVTRYDGQTFTPFGLKIDPETRAVYEDDSGNLWFGTQFGASCYDGRGFTTLTMADGLPGSGVHDITGDGRGNLWLATDDGTYRYDGSRVTRIPLHDSDTATRVIAIMRDSSGRMWVGGDSGATCYDGDEMTTFTTQDGLISNGVRSMHGDSHGHIWFGTVGGASRYDGSSFITFTAEDGLTDNPVFTICERRNGELWFGIRRGGACRYDGDQSTTFDSQDGLASNVRRILEDRLGNLWFSTARGAYRYDGQMVTTFSVEDGLSPGSVETMYEDHDGNIWIATATGLNRYDGQHFQTFTIEDGLVHNYTTAILQDRRGDLWFGSRHIGLTRYDGENFQPFTAQDGLAGDGVTAILQDDEGHLWFGTNGGGVCRYDGRGFTTFTKRDGLAGDVVFSIAQDSKGYLWFGTNGGGASRYDGRSFATLSTSEGLAGNVVWSIVEDTDGAMWLGTNNGASRIKLPPAVPPVPSIDAVVADRRYGALEGVSFPQGAGPVAIEFRALSLKTQPGGMRYRYRLAGYEEEWHNTHERRAEYGNLAIGSYVFEVYAVDRDLVYSEAPATIGLTVMPDPRIEALAQALSQAGQGGLVGESRVLRQAESQLAEVAKTDITVLILGETGTGKGLAANSVHLLSERREGPFVQVNCGAIPEGLFESEIFGHERGAFTGATSRKLGKVELATGGTLFLDEIGDLPLQAQVKMLRLLEEGTFERVGGSETLRMDVRVIAATNHNLESLVADQSFREDLYFRLHAFPVKLPALRERLGDILLLAVYFMDRMGGQLRKEVERITPEAVAELQKYHWPGNVRELENVIQRAVIVCDGPALEPAHLALGTTNLTGGLDEALTPDEYERLYIERLLEKSEGVIRGPRGAAKIWGVPESTLRSRMKKLKISRTGLAADSKS